MLEAFIFNFNQTIYGQRVGIEFLHKLRDEQRFADMEALVQQMQSDVTQAREYFSATSAVQH